MTEHLNPHHRAREQMSVSDFPPFSGFLFFGEQGLDRPPLTFSHAATNLQSLNEALLSPESNGGMIMSASRRIDGRSSPEASERSLVRWIPRSLRSAVARQYEAVSPFCFSIGCAEVFMQHRAMEASLRAWGERRSPDFRYLLGQSVSDFSQRPAVEGCRRPLPIPRATLMPRAHLQRASHKRRRLPCGGSWSMTSVCCVPTKLQTVSS